MRLFIGLPLSPTACEDTFSLASRAQSVIPGRYVLKSNYHITLAFLGEVAAHRLEEAAAVIDAFAARFPAPRITLSALSHFGKPENAIFIRRAESPDPLDDMHDMLAQALAACGLPCADGPFSPHVTIARHANLTAAPLPEALSVSFTAPEAVLFLSARDEDNILRYTPVHTAPFGPRS